MPINEEKKSEFFSLESIILIINNSLIKACESLQNNKITIKSAEITLKTAYDKSGGGGFKLFVKASKKWELEKACSITFKYDTKSSSEAKKGKDANKFEENLTNAIVIAGQQWLNSTDTVGNLPKSNFTVEISFTTKKNTDVGIEFEIWGIGVDLGGDYETTAVHSVSLTFE